MLQLNWSNSLSSKERNLSLPLRCTVPLLPLCKPLALALVACVASPALRPGRSLLLFCCLGVVAGWFLQSSWSNASYLCILNVTSQMSFLKFFDLFCCLALDPISFSEPIRKCVGCLLEVSPNLRKMEKIGVPVVNMDEMCMLEMILLCVGSGPSCCWEIMFDLF